MTEDTLKTSVKNETCTRCGKDMGYPENIHIHDPRRNDHYVEGSGQLCDEHFVEIYGED